VNETSNDYLNVSRDETTGDHFNADWLVYPETGACQLADAPAGATTAARAADDDEN
jgi:hypothetical protein